MKHHFQPVDKLYQAGEPPRWAQSLENQTLCINGWQSRPLSLFGIRLYKGGLPTISPHGTLRVSVSFSDIIQIPEDFLLPLRRDGPNGVSDRLYRSNPGNHYFEFVYVREVDIKAPDLGMNYDTWEWLQQWKIGRHEYIKLKGSTLSYRQFVAVIELWYDILVPYRIEFDVGDESVWDEVGLANNWSNRYQVTDTRTAAFVQALSIFR